MSRFGEERESNERFSRRLNYVLWMLVILTGVLIGRLIYLQVHAVKTYRTLSYENRIYTRQLSPERGDLYDRHGEVLATNRLDYSVSVVPELIEDREALLAWLDDVLAGSGYEREAFLKRLRASRIPYSSVEIAAGFGLEAVARIAEGRYRFRGIKIGARSLRHYPQGEIAAHVIGYLSTPDAEDLRRHESDAVLYRHINRIGRTGLEAQHEAVLVGRAGHETVEVDVRGNAVRQLKVQSPQPGGDVVTSLDLGMMRAAHRAMRGRRGAVVALDVATGAVRVLLSSPAFDPGALNSLNYQRWTESRDKPLFNRALQAQYPPGSVIKPVVALSGLRQGVLNWEDVVHDRGVYTPKRGNRIYRDWQENGHGETDLFKAIYRSCDVYFWSYAERIGVESLGVSLGEFGLGRSLGLGDTPGLIPSPQWRKVSGRAPWMPGDLLNLIIGQGDLLASPLQLAYMTAVLASSDGQVPLPSFEADAPPGRAPGLNDDGTLQTGLDAPEQAGVGLGGAPGLNDDETLQTGLDTPEQALWFAGYTQADIDNVRRALLRVTAADGTAPRASWGHRFAIAGKTGTAQVVTLPQWDDEGNPLKKSDVELSEEQQDHALFIGYAPAEAPEVAVVAVVENGGSGGRVASEVVRDVVVSYLRAEQRRRTRSAVADQGDEASGGVQ
ncbi:MAG: penicillin-binding protein 2 [Gammaproteobacteria bacterium AqS3]|nr:penicillin-binding protein 2 [Gammaproteobacteria bacterium AqS3]